MTNSTTVVEIHEVSKRFVIRKEKSLKERLVNFGRSNQHKEDFWALRDVDLDITSGSTVGLVGPNGSGKSTLLKCIGGIVQPTTGTVSLRGWLAALLELGAGFHPDLTGRENVFLNASLLGLSRAQTEKYFDAIVDFSGIERFIDTQVKFYSSGMYVRLAFAVAVHVDPDILLVDEVLAVGDEPFQRKCMDRIRGFQKEGRTIVFVSHSLDQVAELCDRAVVLEHGNVIADGAPVESLRVLRGEFEATRSEELARERATTTATPTGATITDVRICEPVAADVPVIAPGDPLAFDVEVDAGPGPLTDWVLGIGIDSMLGQVLYGTNTELMKVDMPAISGRHTFRMRLPQVWLGEGQYSLHGAIATVSGPEIDRRAEAATFRVAGDGRSVGILFADPTLTQEGVTGVADPLPVEDVWQSADSQELVSEIHRLETHLAVATSLPRHALHTARERGGALDARVRARLADPHGPLAAVPAVPATATLAELLGVAAHHDDAALARGGEHRPVARRLAAWDRVTHAAGATESGLLALRRRLKR